MKNLAYREMIFYKKNLYAIASAHDANYEWLSSDVNSVMKQHPL